MLKFLHQQRDTPTHKLLLQFYINFVLTSEIIDHTISKDIDFDGEGFFIGNENIINFDKYAFLRFEDNRAFYVDNKEEFLHRKIESDSKLYYSPQKAGWFALLDNPKIENIDLNELYWDKTKKEAYNIQYISVNSQKEPYSKSHIKKLKNGMGLFGVKYRYSVVNGLICYLDTKGDLRLIETPTKAQIRELSELGLKLRKRSLILYKKNNQKATKDNINSFKSTAPYKDKIFYKNKNIKAKEIFYLNKVELVNRIDSDNNTYFINQNDIEVYLFKAVHIIYSNSKGEKRYILYKSKKESKKRGTQYHYEKNAKGIIDKREHDLIPKEYNHKIVSYSTQAHNTTYELLFLSRPKEKIINLNTDNKKIYYRRSLKIEEIRVDIFPNLKNIKDLSVGLNHLLIVDLDNKKFANIYNKVLYRFRNSIAHAEFKIEENEIKFCNTDNSKIVFKARIERKRVEKFMEDLLKRILS